MIIALAEYARLHNRSGDTLRRLAENGSLKTAQKIGRNWTVDSEEEYPSKRKVKSKPITVVSLFSGCGGMDLGLIGGFDFLGKHYAKTGFDIIWAKSTPPLAKHIGKTLAIISLKETLENRLRIFHQQPILSSVDFLVKTFQSTGKCLA